MYQGFAWGAVGCSFSSVVDGYNDDLCDLIGIICQLCFNKEPPMPTRNVVLTDHQAALVEQLVQSGRYQNASEVLREGLRMVEQRDAEDAYRLAALRKAAQEGIADIDAGRFKTFESKQGLRDHMQGIAAKVRTVQ